MKLGYAKAKDARQFTVSGKRTSLGSQAACSLKSSDKISAPWFMKAIAAVPPYFSSIGRIKRAGFVRFRAPERLVLPSKFSFRPADLIQAISNEKNPVILRINIFRVKSQISLWPRRFN